MQFKLLKLSAVSILLFCHSLTANSQKDAYNAMVTRTANELGVSGYAKCAAATTTMLALRARGDNLGRLSPNVDPMLNFMSAVRAVLMSKGTPESILDKLIVQSGQIIRSSSDPVLTAMKDFDKCYNDAIR